MDGTERVWLVKTGGQLEEVDDLLLWGDPAAVVSPYLVAETFARQEEEREERIEALERARGLG